MTTITDIFRTYRDQYLAKFGDQMPKAHKKVIDSIVNCRNGAFGTLLYECQSCGKKHEVMRSCGNRHCPGCQHHKTQQWLKKQLKRKLPGHHFMITFTVPQQLRPIIRSNPEAAYSAMFKASSETIKAFAADKRFVGGDLPGFFGVLHTWGRQLQYHPHIHYVVPGGAFSTIDGQWHSSGLDFFAPVTAMSIVFRAKLRDEFQRAGLLHLVDPNLWSSGFNVNCEAAGQGQNSLNYLASYVFKVAISNSRIIKVENDQVFFRYKKQKSNRQRVMVLDALEFMRSFLQHVLPSGFMKVRYYGFMHHNCEIPLSEISAQIQLAHDLSIQEQAPVIEEPIAPFCQDCGGLLILRACLIPYAKVYSGFT